MNFSQNSDVFGCLIEFVDLRTIKTLTTIEGDISKNMELNSKIVTKKYLGKIWGEHIIELVYSKYGFQETIKNCSELSAKGYEMVVDAAYEHILKNKCVPSEIFTDIYWLNRERDEKEYFQENRNTEKFKFDEMVEISIKIRNKHLLQYMKLEDFTEENKFATSIVYLTEKMFYSTREHLEHSINYKQKIQDDIEYLFKNGTARVVEEIAEEN